jgi:hypothetical protein
MQQQHINAPFRRSGLFLVALASAWILSCQSPTQTPEATVTLDSIKPAAAEQVTAPAATPFQQSLTYGKISFNISSPGTAEANTVTVTPSGFTATNEPSTLDIRGLVTGAETGEMDGDNAPELAIFIQEGADKKGTALVFSANKDKSLSMVSFPEITDANALQGYQGGDEYAFVENRFVRRFPIYANGQKSGKMRQFQYKLKPGEAMKQLVLDKQIEF